MTVLRAQILTPHKYTSFCVLGGDLRNKNPTRRLTLKALGRGRRAPDKELGEKESSCSKYSKCAAVPQKGLSGLGDDGRLEATSGDVS